MFLPPSASSSSRGLQRLCLVRNATIRNCSSTPLFGIRFGNSSIQNKNRKRADRLSSPFNSVSTSSHPTFQDSAYPSVPPKPNATSSTPAIEYKTRGKAPPLNVKSYTRSGLVMTRIVCTIGPAVEAPEMLQTISDGGMKIARLNFSHNIDYKVMAEKIHAIRDIVGAHRRVNHDFNLRAVLLDTKGPEVRSGGFVGGAKEITLQPEDYIILTTDPKYAMEGSAERIYVDYLSLANTVKDGGFILVDDGIIRLQVVEAHHKRIPGPTGDTSYTETLCQVRNKSEVTLGARKGVNIPNTVLDLPALTEKDQEDIKFGIENDVDIIAASFIRKASDVRQVIAYLERLMEKSNINLQTNPRRVRPLVISKIENAEAVENFDEIVAESDGIMVARGDLGVEIPFADVFTCQKEMVKKCNEAGKPVIVATQMLDSMMRNPRPTRAEVSDVGNAVLDGADCVMLSGETAAGKYPAESVSAMMKCILPADKRLDKKSEMSDFSPMYETSIDPNTSEELETVAMSTVHAANALKADLIIVLTTRGTFAKAIARHRPKVPVMAFCTEIKIARQLQIHRGLFPVVPENVKGYDVEDIPEAIRAAKEIGWVRAGDKVIVANYELWDKPTVEQSMNLRVLRVR